MTRQEFKDECDLGLIIQKFSSNPEGLEAFLSARNFVQGRFEDVSAVVDYQTALAQVKQADEAFMRLPAKFVHGLIMIPRSFWILWMIKRISMSFENLV